jgi:hypothetical protein
MPRRVFPTDHYSEQARKCAAAALASTIAEIREAYLNLEQGWLHLAPDSVSGRNPSIEVASTGSIHTPARGRLPSAAGDANRQQNACTDRTSRNEADAPRSRFTPPDQSGRRKLRDKSG